MGSPSRCVTVAVAATVKSPLSSTAPMASPGANGLTSLDTAVAADVVDPEIDPIGTGMKPMASRYLPKRWIVSGAKLPSERGMAIGLVALTAAGRAPHRLV